MSIATTKAARELLRWRYANTPRESRPCPTCGEVYPMLPLQRYCSRRCKDRALYVARCLREGREPKPARDGRVPARLDGDAGAA